MPAGCEFICKNEACEHHNKGFNLTGPWPMGRIELVLNAKNVKKNDNFRNELIKLKNEGRKYACITYPNISNIKILAYRVHMWSNVANCVWQYDVMAKDNDELAKNMKDVPCICPSSGGELWDFERTVKEGILCPHCKVLMKQSRWFSNQEK